MAKYAQNSTLLMSSFTCNSIFFKLSFKTGRWCLIVSKQGHYARFFTKKGQKPIFPVQTIVVYHTPKSKLLFLTDNCGSIVPLESASKILIMVIKANNKMEVCLKFGWFKIVWCIFNYFCFSLYELMKICQGVYHKNITFLIMGDKFSYN